MISEIYKTLRSAISSRYPSLTRTYQRERKALKALGDAEPHSFFRSPDCLAQMNEMARARTKGSQLSLFDKTSPIQHHPDKKLPAITLCLVTYNSSPWVNEWVQSLASLNYPKSKLKLSWVDNDSSDDTVVKLRAALTEFGFQDCMEEVVHQNNAGFGAGQNLAVKTAETDLVLIINPDAKLEPSSLKIAVNYALSDSKDISCWEFSQTPYEHPKYYDPVTLETSWNSHACVLIKRAAFLEVGGYDTNLFLYGEDVELSYKLRAHGYKLRYLPKARIYHDITPNSERRIDQSLRSITANLLLRRRYGTHWDRFVGKTLMLKSTLSSRHDSKNKLSSAQALYSELKSAFLPNRPKNIFFPFNGFEYERRRLGQFTPITLNTPILNSLSKSSQPRVSVITRVHKQTPLLYDAIRCVQNQTYPNTEHVIVFDGCDPIAHENIKAVISNNMGRSAAANKGAKAASGEYILFLDYDDLIFADHIEGLVNRLKATPQAVCTYSYSWEAMTESRQIRAMSQLGLQAKMETQFDPTKLNQNNFFAIQSVMMKRPEFLKIGGFDTNLEFCEDWDLWRRLIKLGTFEPYEKLTSIYFTPASLRARLARSWDMVRQRASRSDHS